MTFRLKGVSQNANDNPQNWKTQGVELNAVSITGRLKNYTSLDDEKEDHGNSTHDVLPVIADVESAVKQMNRRQRRSLMVG